MLSNAMELFLMLELLTSLVNSWDFVLFSNVAPFLYATHLITFEVVSVEVVVVLVVVVEVLMEAARMP